MIHSCKHIVSTTHIDGERLQKQCSIILCAANRVVVLEISIVAFTTWELARGLCLSSRIDPSVHVKGFDRWALRDVRRVAAFCSCVRAARFPLASAAPPVPNAEAAVVVEHPESRSFRERAASSASEKRWQEIELLRNRREE